ncbi:hypothetical protein T4C_11034 [Trichinella pseudospiralis]|uniref:RRM domain-containing protein n=1 Tax=Trichinella pseudospiralis TaxID=6337 RepID=A0A0V1K9C2_TRIPS|nr:hypothetical protein T4C_11034 [Trichinella pseudospiralis]
MKLFPSTVINLNLENQRKQDGESKLKFAARAPYRPLAWLSEFFSKVNMSSSHRGHRQGNSQPAPSHQRMHENPVQPHQHKSSGRLHPNSRNRSSDLNGNPNSAKVKISNLSPKVDKDDVHFVFEEFGKVVNVEMHVGDLLINNIGYAIVEFDSLKSAENARCKQRQMLISTAMQSQRFCSG